MEPVDAPTEVDQELADLGVDRVLDVLRTRRAGLSADEVAESRAQVGPNVLQAATRFRWYVSLGKQFTNFFTLLLLGAAAICFVAHWLRPGESMQVLGLALLGVSVLNAAVAFLQEYRAERAMEALARFLPQRVTVVRDGAEHAIGADELVPGDVLVLHEGDRIPADARVVDARALQVNNAPLTGESRSVVVAAERHGDDGETLVFAGCAVVRGSGTAVVFATGPRTAFGRLAALSGDVTRNPSPLERETNHMVRVLTRIAMSMGALFFAYGVLTGRDLMTNLVFVMGIIVANVPEGLLPTFTLSLGVASLRMAKRNVLVRGLSAVEAIGAIHVICTDKTGTLTRNELAVTGVIGPEDGEPLTGDAERAVLRDALLASEVHVQDDAPTGDPVDVAILDRYGESGIEVVRAVTRALPFDVDLRRSGGVGPVDGAPRFAVKGAWEALRPMLSRVGNDAATPEALARAEAVVEGLTARGTRVLAVAARPVDDADAPREDLEADLDLVGFLALEDPLRDEVPDAVATCHTAGIDVIMITGDHPNTAAAIARSAGVLPADHDGTVVLTGDAMAALTIEEVADRIEGGVRVFARATPEQKMKIILALQGRGRTVAMTGDGVNDAPALKAADVGIAMGKGGTDVAREAAQIVLLDDNFASIVAGVEEGRTVFANIKKFTNYVLVSNGPEILPYLLYILLPVPLALTVIQILSIDLGTDIVPSMALGQEPPEPDTMKRPPRRRDEGLLRWPLVAHSYLFLGLLQAVWSLTLFALVMAQGGWSLGDAIPDASDPTYQSATGIALSTILLMQIGNLIGRRSRLRSGLDRGLFTNPLLVAGIVIQIAFSWATLYLPAFHTVLGTGPVDLWVYGLAWLGIPLIFGVDWLRKQVLRRREANA